MPNKKTADSQIEGEGIVMRDGERYLSIERTAEYVGKARSTVFVLIKRHGLQTYTFPLEGKRVFLRQSDLDALKRADPRPTR